MLRAMGVTKGGWRKEFFLISFAMNTCVELSTPNSVDPGHGSLLDVCRFFGTALSSSQRHCHLHNGEVDSLHAEPPAAK